MCNKDRRTPDSTPNSIVNARQIESTFPSPLGIPMSWRRIHRRTTTTLYSTYICSSCTRYMQCSTTMYFKKKGGKSGDSHSLQVYTWQSSNPLTCMCIYIYSSQESRISSITDNLITKRFEIAFHCFLRDNKKNIKGRICVKNVDRALGEGNEKEKPVNCNNSESSASVIFSHINFYCFSSQNLKAVHNALHIHINRPMAVGYTAVYITKCSVFCLNCCCCAHTYVYVAYTQQSIQFNRSYIHQQLHITQGMAIYQYMTQSKQTCSKLLLELHESAIEATQKCLRTAYSIKPAFPAERQTMRRGSKCQVLFTSELVLLQTKLLLLMRELISGHKHSSSITTISITC